MEFIAIKYIHQSLIENFIYDTSCEHVAEWIGCWTENK